MISDEALVKYANRTKGISRNALEVVYLVIQEMATELLQYREEKRKADEARAKSWEGAPEWANCRAKDQYDEWIYFDLRTYPSAKEQAAIQFDRDHFRGASSIIRWIATLETRP